MKAWLVRCDHREFIVYAHTGPDALDKFMACGVVPRARAYEATATRHDDLPIPYTVTDNRIAPNQ